MFVPKFKPSLALKNQLYFIACQVGKICVTKASEGLIEGKMLL